MDQLRYTRLDGAGNQILVVDARLCNQQPSPISVQFWAQNPETYFDQLMWLVAPTHADAALNCLIFNADGSIAKHCGNGLRCVGRFLEHTGHCQQWRIYLETSGRVVELSVHGEQINVDMGPAQGPDPHAQWVMCTNGHYHLPDLPDHIFYPVSLGNLHAVHIVHDLQSVSVETLGALYQSHSGFPDGVNAGWMAILDRNTMMLRVYERGVGETQACGSGACAAVWAGHQLGLLNAVVDVNMPGGRLTVDVTDRRTNYLSGPATILSSGMLPAAAPSGATAG